MGVSIVEYEHFLPNSLLKKKKKAMLTQQFRHVTRQVSPHHQRGKQHVSEGEDKATPTAGFQIPTSLAVQALMAGAYGV